MNEIWCRLRQSRGGINVSLSYHIYSGTECETRSIIFNLVTSPAKQVSYHACSGAESGKAGEASTRSPCTPNLLVFLVNQIYRMYIFIVF